MRPGVAGSFVAVSLLFCTQVVPSCNVDPQLQPAQHILADPGTWRHRDLHHAIGCSLRFADRHQNLSGGPSCNGASGVSTYISSSQLQGYEAVPSKNPAPGKHKALWPLNSRDWWALGTATVAVFVAAGGGIGGGGVLVPLFASVLGQYCSFGVKHFRRS